MVSPFGKTTCPFRTSCSPDNTRSRVDLPAPFFPTSPALSPSRRVQLIPSKWSGRQNAGSDSESRSCCKGIAEIWVDLSVSQIVRLCPFIVLLCSFSGNWKNNNREWFQSNRKAYETARSMCWRSLPPYWMACLHSTPDWLLLNLRPHCSASTEMYDFRTINHPIKPTSGLC